MLKNKKQNLIFITIIGVIAIYFSVQFYYLKFVYAVDVFVDITELAYTDETITITRTHKEDYLEYENIRVGNFFEDFSIRNPDYITHISKFYAHDTISANFWFGSSEQMATDFLESFILFSEEFETNVDHQLILDRHNINTDADLIKLAANAKRSNIFTPIRQMRENYILHNFAEVVLSQVKGIALVDGAYTGRMITLSQGKELQIVKNNRVYFFTFLNLNYFNDERIQTIINTIIID